MRYVTSHACAAKLERRRSGFDHGRRCGRFVCGRSPHGRRVKTVASQAHELLLEADPQREDAELIKAAQVAETSPSTRKNNRRPRWRYAS